MLRGLWRLTWLEIKIFAARAAGLRRDDRDPGADLRHRWAACRPGEIGGRFRRRIPDVALPVFASLLIPLSAVMSLVTIIAIYREGGILKRLRATPLRPYTILTAHVLVKLLFTAVTLAAAPRRAAASIRRMPTCRSSISPSRSSFSTWSILSIGFLIASLVPTARFAQPLARHPVSDARPLGPFVPVALLPRCGSSRARCRHLCGVAAAGDLGRRRLVGACGRRRRSGGPVRCAWRFIQAVSLGVKSERQVGCESGRLLVC